MVRTSGCRPKRPLVFHAQSGGNALVTCRSHRCSLRLLRWRLGNRGLLLAGCRLMTSGNFTGTGLIAFLEWLMPVICAVLVVAHGLPFYVQ